MRANPWALRGAVRPARAALALAVAACAAAALPTPALAQDSSDARILTLKQAFDAAWQRQPEARSIGARRDAADAQVAFAQRWTAEPIALDLAGKTDQLTGNRGGREYLAGISAPLWLPGERGGAQAVAHSERSLVDSRIGAAQWRLAGAVREAWWAVQRAGLETTLSQARLTNAQELAADVALHVRVGDLARSDQLQADGTVAAARSAVAEAQAAQGQSRQALVALVGTALAETLPAAAETAPAELAPGGSPPGPGAGPDHPALRELGARAELALRSRELVSVQTRANPELALLTTRERGAFGETYGQYLEIGVRIPFGSSDRQRSRLATAGAEQTEAESQLEIERGRVAADIGAAGVRVRATRLIVEASDTRAALAFETRRIFEKSFRLGETDLHTRLRVDLEAFEAERQRERSRIDLAQAVSQWRQALGLLPE